MLVWLGYAAFNVLMLYRFFFTARQSNLHALEILTYWMTASMLFQNYSALMFMNFKLFIVPDVLSLELTHLMNRIVLFPLLTVIFLDRYAGLDGRGARMLWTFAAILFFTGMEWLADWTNVLNHAERWQLWWTLAFWSFFVLVHLLIRMLFGNKLRKELAIT